MPFTIEQFLKVFESYNQAIYPVQWILFFLAIGAVFMAVKACSYSSKIIAGVLALLWLWMGIAYHLVFFSTINKAAYLFGLLCIIQASIFLFTGIVRKELYFQAKSNVVGIIGWVFIAFALLVYPALGYLFEHIYPQSPTFGAPCPTTIFTFGILLWTERRLPVYVLVIPFVWSLIGFSAAINLGIREDIGLVFAGLVGTLLVIWKNSVLPETVSNNTFNRSAD